jgi:protein gp37
VSPGCAHCYAETFAERFRGVKGHPYEQGFDLRLVPEKLAEPLSWKKPRRVFVNSMSDLFQEGVPDEYVDRVFAVMALRQQHTFQILTKRADRMRDYLTAPMRMERVILKFGEFVVPGGMKSIVKGSNCVNGLARGGWPLPNVWLGVSVENQHFADERIPLLLRTPAAIRFISAEPLLGPVDLHRCWLDYDSYECPACGDIECNCGALDWVIVGGESGHGARPFDIAWARSIVAQCGAAGVACFVKQLGAKAYGPDIHSAILNDRKGGDITEWPVDLQVREYPVVTQPSAERPSDLG